MLLIEINESIMAVNNLLYSYSWLRNNAMDVQLNIYYTHFERYTYTDLIFKKNIAFLIF